MPKIKLNEDQKKLLALTRAADQEWRDAKEKLEEEIRAEKKKRIEALAVKRGILAYQCKQAMIPVTCISRDALDTSATITAYDAIKLGEQYAPKPETEVESHEISRIERGRIRVTPPADALAPLLPLLGIERAEFDAHAELQHADFLVDAADEIVSPITEGWNEALGVRHPVVALVMGEDASYRARILEAAA